MPILDPSGRPITLPRTALGPADNLQLSPKKDIVLRIGDERELVLAGGSVWHLTSHEKMTEIKMLVAQLQTANTELSAVIEQLQRNRRRKVKLVHHQAIPQGDRAN